MTASHRGIKGHWQLRLLFPVGNIGALNNATEFSWSRLGPAPLAHVREQRLGARRLYLGIRRTSACVPSRTRHGSAERHVFKRLAESPTAEEKDVKLLPDILDRI